MAVHLLLRQSRWWGRGHEIRNRCEEGEEVDVVDDDGNLVDRWTDTTDPSRVQTELIRNLFKETVAGCSRVPVNNGPVDNATGVGRLRRGRFWFLMAVTGAMGRAWLRDDLVFFPSLPHHSHLVSWLSPSLSRAPLEERHRLLRYPALPFARGLLPARGRTAAVWYLLKDTGALPA
jgi:hypothetical protein